MTSSRLWFLLPGTAAIALAVVGCPATETSDFNPGAGGGGAGAGGGQGGTLPHELYSITINPTNTTVELDLNEAGAVAFQAIGNFEDGTTEDLTMSANWNVVNDLVGTISAGNLTIPAFTATAAESSIITAEFEGYTGEAQVTVVAYRQSGTQQDFFFVLPYEDPVGSQAKPLDFGTAIPALDVFFMMDTTGSMAGEINNLQTALTGTVIPGIQAVVSNTEFGAGVFEDFPLDPYGSLQGSDCGGGGSPLPDQPFKLFQEITNDVAAVTMAVDSFSVGSGGPPIGCGNDLHESMIEGLFQAASGTGLTGPSPTSVPANATGIGGVGFRDGTMPVTVVVSDAASHAPGEAGNCTLAPGEADYTGAVGGVAATRQQAKDSLNAICGRVVGVASAGLESFNCHAEPDLEDFATATGSRVPPEAWDVGTRPAGCAAGQCCTDIDGGGRAPDVDGLCPVVFRTDQNGNGLGDAVVTGIQMLARFATFDVTTETVGENESIHGDPLPAGVTTADFIQAITPTGFTLPPPPPTLPNPTFDATTFQNVTPGTTVQFDVTAYNDFLEVDEPKIYRATIRVLAGGCTPLDEREVFILVPPTAVVPK